MVSRLNVYAIIKKDFRSALGLCKSMLKTLEAPTIDSNC